MLYVAIRTDNKEEYYRDSHDGDEEAREAIREFLAESKKQSPRQYAGLSFKIYKLDEDDHRIEPSVTQIDL